MKWILLVTAPDQISAEMWRDLLIEEGIPAMLEPRDALTFLGVSAIPCRLLVPEGLEKEAAAILEMEQGGEGQAGGL